MYILYTYSRSDDRLCYLGPCEWATVAVMIRHAFASGIGLRIIDPTGRNHEIVPA